MESIKIQILHYKIFDNLAQSLNFRRTAKELNLSIAIVSKKIKELESYYQTNLFYRTTRSVNLSESGKNILPRIKELILIEQQIQLDIKNDYEFVGNLKVGIPFSYFESILDKIKHHTLDRKISIEWKTGNYLNRLYDDNYDVIIFCGPLPDGNFYAKKISQWKKIICASPDFINRYGYPKTPSELMKYPCLDHSENFKQTWLLDRKYQINLTQKCSSSSLLANMTVNSLGLSYLPSFTVDKYIKQGLLVEILAQHTSQKYDTYIVSKTPISKNTKAQKLLEILSS